MRKRKPKSKAGPAVAVASTSHRVVVPISGVEHDNQNENLEAFLRDKKQHQRQGNSSSATVTVKAEPNLDPEPEVVIPDPDSSPPIIAYEWRASSKTPTHDHDTDSDTGRGTGEEFILGLDSNGARSPNSVSPERQIHTEVVRREVPRQTSPQGQKLKPGPKSRKKLLNPQVPPPASRSSFASHSKSSQDSSPGRKRRRKPRRSRYTLTKEDIKEALEKALVYESDNDDGSASATDTDVNMNTFSNNSQTRVGASDAKSSPSPAKAQKPKPIPMKPKAPKVNKQTTPKKNGPCPGPGPGRPTRSAVPANDNTRTGSQDSHKKNCERVIVELREPRLSQDSTSPITVSISKASLDLIRQRPKETLQQREPAVLSTLRSSSSQSQSQSKPQSNAMTKAAIRTLLTRRRNAAQANGKLYRRLLDQSGQCKVKLFDMGFIQKSVPRINANQYVGLIKALGSVDPSPSTSTSASARANQQEFNPESTQVRKLVHKFWGSGPKANSKPSKSKSSKPARKQDSEIERLRRQFKIRSCIVKMNDVGGPPVTCPVCEQNVPIGSLAYHKAGHRIRCYYPGCGLNVLLGDVVTHGTSHITVLRCETCSLSTKTRVDLWCHQNTHYGVKPLICTECGESFAFTSSYKRHCRLHEQQQQENGNEAGVEGEDKNVEPAD